MDERLERTINALSEIGADWAILSGAESIAYTLGYSPSFEAGPSPFAGGPNIAVVGRDGSAGLLALRGEGAGVREGEVYYYDGYAHGPSSPPQAAYKDALKALLRGLRVGGVLAIEMTTLPLTVDALLPPGRRVDIAAAFRRQRMTKTEAEIDALRRAAEVAAAGQRRLLEAADVEVSELQLFSEVRCAMETEAGGRIAVAGDLLSGRERTAAVWGWPSRRRILFGDAVLADLAPRVDGYWGDSCSTVVVGSPTDGQARIFTAAKGALELAVAMLRPGISADEAHRKILDCVRKAGFDYSHHTGHSIGTAVHEHPRLAQGEKEVLRAGMVLMVEPGAYSLEIGGARTEWMLEITETGCRPLAPFPLCPGSNATLDR